MTAAPRRRLGRESLAARAGYVLRGNDLGRMTSAAPQLYPHMWSWDAGFVAIGLATVDLERAIVELDSLLGAQWKNGMLPHIVFAPEATDYFPGPDRWGCAELATHAPRTPATSGICQPPVHALAVARIVGAARRRGFRERQAAQEFLARAWPALMSWHRWLADSRDPDQVGRLTVHHGWESGMDNSPRWDGPYARVAVGPDLPPYQRRDNRVVGDSSQRPSDREYDRYLWLIEEMRAVGYDDAEVRRTGSFVVEDVFASAIFAVACDVLAELGEDARQWTDDVADLRTWADRFKRGVASSVDPTSGLARDRDVRTGEWLAVESIAGFAPLLCGGLDRSVERAMLDLFESPSWSGHPDFVAAVPPSAPPHADGFRPREYWRGPQWPVMAWLFDLGFAHRGWTDRSLRMREEGLCLVSDGSFAEYYEPFTGEPLGSMRQSWTAAAVLDWLC